MKSTLTLLAIIFVVLINANFLDASDPPPSITTSDGYTITLLPGPPYQPPGTHSLEYPVEIKISEFTLYGDISSNCLNGPDRGIEVVIRVTKESVWIFSLYDEGRGACTYTPNNNHLGPFTYTGDLYDYIVRNTCK